jgi:dihydroxyacid dehydratase/phosphogluconate dehydratase
MYTANTMSSAFEALGNEPAVLEHDGQRPTTRSSVAARDAARVLVEAVRRT